MDMMSSTCMQSESWATHVTPESWVGVSNRLPSSLPVFSQQKQPSNALSPFGPVCTAASSFWMGVSSSDSGSDTAFVHILLPTAGPAACALQSQKTDCFLLHSAAVNLHSMSSCWSDWSYVKYRNFVLRLRTGQGKNNPENICKLYDYHGEPPWVSWSRRWL